MLKMTSFRWKRFPEPDDLTAHYILTGDIDLSAVVSSCSVSGSIIGGGNYVDAVVGDPACAVSVDCERGMTLSPALDTAA